MEKAKRYELLDIIRGLAILNMIFYHAIWDIANIFSKNADWFNFHIFYIWQQSICITFILLSGFCFSLGKRPLKRGFIVFLGGLIISLVTAIFMPEQIIIFGILTLIGSCMIITSALDRLFIKLNPIVGFFLCVILFIVTKNINSGYIWFFEKILLPDALYNGYLGSFLGFCDKSFSSSDYFSIMPWIFLFECGYFLYYILKKYDLLNFLKCKKIFLLSFIGKNSLLIYMLHQPVIYSILYLVYLK